jgi:hypothetical protein
MAKDDAKTAEPPKTEPPAEAQGFKKHGALVKGVQPQTADDIPDAGK